MIIKDVEALSALADFERSYLDQFRLPEMIAKTDEFVIAELAQSPIDMRDAQTERIADQLLCQRHSERALVRHTDDLQPCEQLQEEMGDPFQRRSSPNIESSARRRWPPRRQKTRTPRRQVSAPHRKD